MKNFLRSLRWTWPYRGRLFLSIVCALCGAALFGANLSIVYPAFRLLESKDKKWADLIGADIDQFRVQYKKVDEDPYLEGVRQRLRHIQDTMAPSPERDREERKLSGEIAKYDGRLSAL